MTRLFLYGTLLDPALLARFAGRALAWIAGAATRRLWP